jgi:hypothetical protein
MLELMKDKDLEGRVVVLYGMDNGVYYEEDEDGDRSLPKADEKGKYHVIGKVELATQKQARGLVSNCEPILERIKENRKMLVTPGVRFYREPCCEKVAHCVNMGEGGYRRGMLEDLARIKDAVWEGCKECGMRSYKVVSPVELLGIRVTMEENDLIQLLGDDPVHMSAGGYQRLTGGIINMAENPRTVFAGEKREREEDEEDGGMENYHRRRHDWIYSVVSGDGAGKKFQQAKLGVQDRSRNDGQGTSRVGTSGADRGQQYPVGGYGGSKGNQY